MCKLFNPPPPPPLSSFHKDAKVKTLDRLNSDHCPIMISISSRNFGPKCFKIFKHWMNEDRFSNVVKASWGNMVYTGSPDIVPDLQTFPKDE
ncbi:hypothetical protein Tco_0450029 [Tanacetum coccineum]